MVERSVPYAWATSVIVRPPSTTAQTARILTSRVEYPEIRSDPSLIPRSYRRSAESCQPVLQNLRPGPYAKALAVNSADVRARYNLAWVETRSADYPAALRWIAEALALDKT